MTAKINLTQATRKPAIPDTTGVPAQIKAVLDAVKENIEVTNGSRGDPLDKALSWRDLYNQGVIKVTLNGQTYQQDNGGTFTPVASDPLASDFTPPPAPTHLTASSGMTSVILTWDAPNFPQFAFTEVWRSTDSTFGNAVLIGTTNAALYADSVGATSVNHWYWIRFVSKAAVPGAFNSLTGTQGATGVVGGQDLGPLIVTADKIANGAIGVDQLGYDPTTGLLKVKNAAIGAAAIANAAIGTAAIADAAITDAKIASLSAAKITAGTIGAQSIYLGDGTFQLDGTNRKIWVLDGNNTARVEMGNLGNNQYGLTLRDAAGNIFLTSGGIQSVPTTALQGTLPKSQVSGLGAFAAVDQITNTNVSTYIANGAILSAQIGSAQINSANIASGAITSALIGTGTIQTANIAAAAITQAKIANAAIGTAQIQNAAITNALIGDAAVDTANIVNGAITSALIGSAEVGTAEIANAAITNALIANAAVNTLKIGTNAVTVPYASSTSPNRAGGQITRSGGFPPSNVVQVGSASFSVADAQAVTSVKVFVVQGISGLDYTTCCWWGRLVVDGSVVCEAGGDSWQDTFTLGWAGTLATGSHTATVYWAGYSGTTCVQVNIDIMGAKR